MKKSPPEQAPSEEKIRLRNSRQNGPFQKNAFFNYSHSKRKNFPLLKIFLAPLPEPFTMVLLDINCPQIPPLPYIVYQPAKILHVVVFVMGL
jgi:hypothetical protein